MLLCFLVCICCGHSIPCDVGRVDSLTYDVNTDGSVTLECKINDIGNESGIDHSWVHNGQVLTKNKDILIKNLSRYNVKYQDINDRVYILIISNPVRKDEGIYKCQIDYRWKGNYYSASKYVHITEKDLNQSIMKRSTIQPPETKLTTETSKVPENLITTKPVLLTSQSVPSSRNPHAKQVSMGLTSIRPTRTSLTRKSEKTSTTKASTKTQYVMTTKPVTWANQHWANTKLVPMMDTSAQRLLTLFLITDDTTENKMYMKVCDDEASGVPNLNIILISLIGLCQTIIAIVIILYVRWYYKKRKPTNERTSLAKSSNQASPTIDHTNTPFQMDPETKPDAVLVNQTDESRIGTMTSRNSDYKNMQTYEHHTTEAHSMTASNQLLPTFDSTYIPNQNDSKQAFKAVRMGVASLVKTNLVTPKQRMKLPKLVEFQNLDTFKRITETHSIADLTDQAP